MESWLHDLLIALPLRALFLIIAVALFVLAKEADLLVTEAVALSERCHVPKVVIGADILNVLFVAGLAAAVTPGGLEADPRFYRLLFPGMLTLLIVFRIGLVAPKPTSGAALESFSWSFICSL